MVVWDARDGTESYLLDLQGHELGRLAHSSINPGVAATGSGASSTHLFTIGSGVITFYGSQGARLGSAAFDTGGGFFGPVFTPDDSSWVWTTGGLNGGEAHTTRVLLGGARDPVQVLARHPDPAGQQLVPVAWANRLFYLSEQATNGGDQQAFASLDTAWTLDPASGALRQVPGPDCRLQDVAPDGSLLCLDLAQQTLTVRRASGSTTLHYPGSWEQAGSAGFSADGTRVVISTASPSRQRRGAYVGSASGGEMSPLPATFATFLPDGRILAVHDQGGFDLIAADGTTTSVVVPPQEQTGSFAGVIRHPQG